MDPDLFLQLVRDYQNVEERMRDTVVAHVEPPNYNSVTKGVSCTAASQTWTTSCLLISVESVVLC